MRPSPGTLWSLLLGLATVGSQASDSLTVTASTGIYTGLIEPAFPNVRAFRNIPFAEPPVGKLRWKPPVALPASRRRHYSYRYPANCPQYLPTTLSLWSTNLTDYGIDTDGQSRYAGTVAQTSAEDCLGLAIWTPLGAAASSSSAGASGKSLLPVAFFIHGGAFVQGGVDSPYLKPQQWVSRSQQHIVVSVNWRVNIFGFPNAAGLSEQNLGFLDARLALEWVYANIAAFGGDPARITLWGQSAGAVAADILGFAYPDDPLASALFLQSGNALRQFPRGDNALQTNFTFVARSLGCDFPADQSDAELECMQQVPANLISNFVGQYGDNGTEPALLFRPTVDERTVFANYTTQAKAGKIARIPALLSTTANEDASLTTYPAGDLVAGPDQATTNRLTLFQFVCPAFYGKNVRVYNNLTTYRYQYAGNFSNVSPYQWLGAYHASDIPPVFGTYDLHGGSTELEARVSQRMQDYVLAFLKDAENGLERLGWAPDNLVLKGTMKRFAAGGVVEKTIQSAAVDGACTGAVAYDWKPS
ncbi:Alpha/Beta hydrolase protein [Truncatella angustata]|uniref:Carboxylic ester hydrolase n=1 Tax=Truncatella angustata TaxID=152316 RepID=A0A9P8ZYA2_9PEZI|nr:Alpha/Beta hydrolase protein [Truncatella angustata]KAH6653840.1 Alpha/Beta hydrolase protein [Truncatella angustata]KAH8193982.1 hypothetical protein TruAng_011853 [Truncatella angustata]